MTNCQLCLKRWCNSMEMICEYSECTGCGMCTNICPTHAVSMEKGQHGFVYPQINKSLCRDCGICSDRCPANKKACDGSEVQTVYAAWNNNKQIRCGSTSGGIFTLLAQQIINSGGAVAGVAWDDDFHPRHKIVSTTEGLSAFRGSKYSQSITGDIYKIIKEKLETGMSVMFSGTPCQNMALRSFLGKDYDNLFLIDLVCHGVPSNDMLDRYYSEFEDGIANVNLRRKAPYWDYSYVMIDFVNGKKYKALTIDDPFLNLFNISYSLRQSCHNCHYANTRRISDITLADFWGYRAHNFKSRNYNKGTSLVLVNTDKGRNMFERIKENIFFEESDLGSAKKSNKCLSESFTIDEVKLNEYWDDYEAGVTVSELNKKYCAETFTLPKHIYLRRNINKWGWIIR